MMSLSRRAAHSHSGHQDENQDRYRLFSDRHSGDSLIIVADGMGGRRGGSLAAQAVIDSAETCWRRRQQHPQAESFLLDLVAQAHKAVNAAGEQAGLSPCSTLAALLLHGGQLVSVHVGDSRIMQFSGSDLVKRSIDHSLAQLHVLQGKISEQEMATHADQNKLTTSIGGELAPEPEIENWQPEQGRDFVLCSDGFWELFSQQDISALLQQDDLQQAIEQAIKQRLAEVERHDNTTVVVAHLGQTVRKSHKRRTGLLLAGVALAMLAGLAALWFFL